MASLMHGSGAERRGRPLRLGNQLEPDGHHITFSDGCGIGRLRLVGTRTIETFPIKQIKRIRLIRRADGYYCQFAVQADRTIEHIPTGASVGIDVGLKAFYTDSTSNIIDNPRYFRAAENRIVQAVTNGSGKP
ncbi:MAG TPA: hypothetical protein VL461_08785 [Dictyobacter sp.]|nr:hypothetical protein [Dictyobacter sp.]